MNFRRRYTKNFTTIGNELFNDERLAADELGILAYLRSRPHDWEIRRPALQRRFRIGRDGMKRIITNWLRTGWCQAEKIRLSNGQFKITYEILDEPGPSLSEDDVRTALSVVSADAGDDNSYDGTDSESTGPPTGEPQVDGRLADTRGWEESLNTDSINTEPTKPVALWRDIRAKWPAGDILSPSVCELLWAKLSQADRQQAFQAVEVYVGNCKARNRKLCDLSTYLKERRFVGKLAIATENFPVRGGTPEAKRWLDYRTARGEQTGLMIDLWRAGKPWYAPTQWPPAVKPTGPPDPALTEADKDEIRKWG